MQNEEFLKNQDELFKTFLENTNDLIFILQIDDDVKFIYTNDAAKNRLGYSLDEMNEIGIEGIRKPIDETNHFFKHIDKLKNNGYGIDNAYIRCKDGSEFPVEVNAKLVKHDNTTYNIAIARDITDRLNYNKKLEDEIEEKTKELNENIQKLKSYKEAVDINSIVTISDIQGKIKYANDKFYEICGYKKDEVIGRNHNIVRHPDEPREVFADMWNTILDKKIWRGKLKNLTKDGDTYIVQAVIVPVLDNNGDILEFIATRYEITDIVKKQEEIEKLLKTDALTNLYNRFYLNENLNSASDTASVALIDINSFHEINDFYGDQVGDMVIVKLSNILNKRLGHNYLLFHLSGDEFIVFNNDIPRDIFIDEMIETNNFLNTKTLIINEKTFYLNTTIALSFESKENLMSSVHLAKTYAKQNGLNFNIYNAQNPLEKEYKSNLTWAYRIKEAIQDNRITVFFQPIVEAKTKKILKYESLVRMISKDGEVISPYFFLDKAKKSNQYVKITKIVIDKTFEAILKYNIKSSINITIEDIQNTDTKEYIYEKLEDFDKSENITFELVESEGIENFDEVDEFIKTIKSYGCKLAIDDFGTGYSNFEYLLKLNADFIKIDGSLIKEIDKNQDYYDIVKTIVSFAKIKDLKVVAEFVSSKEIYEKILELEIDRAQGYLFCEPKPME
ncbi:EAL domain-containing protein [Sulfurimonas lithotrophica]|uniref:EAL domain-containing protein n=1 Tax=Sulfurimonas lithotrophica TaxID=2590022 RepID=A0A5P8NZF7_9BACT|nr:bifunctional diguanylate cyclase/phosphodiesterase [Sulfurimonas lithotrophica]QFR48843.1 EAL domain-containing protein [Sulfurimonas lithotrophica]